MKPAAILVCLVTALRLWVASRIGLGDAEAYYWTWSRDIDWSYYDHGPVVALLIRLGTSTLGQHATLAVRAPFILLSAATMWALATLAVRWCPDRSWRTGRWTLIGLMAMPAFQVAGAAANPDVPLLAVVTLFLLALTPPPSGSSGSGSGSGSIKLTRLAAAGALVGVGVCTKLYALALILPLLVAALDHRRRVWAAVLSLSAAALCSLPVLWWNVTHDWAGLTYHLVHRHTQPPGPSLQNLAKLVGGQLGYVSPLLLLGLGAAAVRLIARRKRAQPLVWTCAALLVPGYALILVVPGAEPHWPITGYLPLLLVLGALLPGWYERRGRRLLIWAALAYSLLVAVALHLHVLTDAGVRLLTRAGWYSPRYDLGNELRGWPEVADAVARQLGPRMQVAACHYTSCAQLAFAARDRFVVTCPSPRVDQFDFGPGGDGQTPRPDAPDLLYVKDERFPFDARLLYRCRRASEVSRVEIRRAGGVARTFTLQLCRGFGGLLSQRWPPPQTADAPASEL